MANGYDGPSQITDLGGLPDKQGVEDLAAAGGVSLGTGGNEPSVSPGPARIAPANESLNLGGGVSEYIANSGDQGNFASDGLTYGQGQGKPLQSMTEIEQQRSTAADKALYVYQHSTIPAAKFAAAQVLRGIVISQIQGD